MKRVTIKDIAKIAGVSYATVSRALSNSPEISSATKQRIQAICQEEGYFVNSLAKGLVRRKSCVLGVILPDISNVFFSELALEIDQYAREKGYHIILCHSGHSASLAKEAFEFLISHQVDGIICATTQEEHLEIISLFSPHIPIVLLGELTPSPTLNYHQISINNYLGGQLAACHLAELGHTHIGYIGYRPSNTAHQQRLNGFLDAAAKHHLDVKVYPNHWTHMSSIQSGYQVAQSIVPLNGIHTALFAVTDATALGILRVAEAQNLSVPQDFSLLSFDNCSYSSYPHLHLTTIDQCKQAQAHKCIDLLLENIEHKEPANFRQHYITPVICHRHSCQPLPRP